MYLEEKNASQQFKKTLKLERKNRLKDCFPEEFGNWCLKRLDNTINLPLAELEKIHV